MGPTPDQIVLWGVNEDGSCKCPAGFSCAPKNRGKHPKLTSWEPGDNLGNLTGEKYGRIVVDVDVRSGDGKGEFRSLPGYTDESAATYLVDTASGGWHLYYRHPGFFVGNGKLSANVDVRGDAEGWAYVVAPGSRIVRDDGTVAEHHADEDQDASDLAPCPDWLVAALLARGSTKKEGFAPEPIDEDHPEWLRRVNMAIEACKTMPPSRADGSGGKALFAVALQLVRKLELPVEKAHELIAEHFNPRCTDTNDAPYPWEDDDILHKLEDARTKSDLRTGVFSEATEKGLAELRARMAKPAPLRDTTTAAAPDERTKVSAGDAFDGERRKISRTEAVQVLMSSPDWSDVLWYDVLKRRPFAVNPPMTGKMTLEEGQMSKADLALIAHWFDARGMLVSKELVEDALWTVVKSPTRRTNAIAKYLDALPPVTEATVLPTLATDILGATDPFANTLVLKTLVAAARRARNPGHRHRAMLVLKGEQKCGKSATVKILAGFNEERRLNFYHSTGNGNIADRDTILECQGALFVEVEELSALSKADENALKTAVSREVDVITKKYEPDAHTYPRSFVFVGTTNKDEFLTDSTGNTRYWVVEIPKDARVDVARLEKLRDVLWAEADFLAKTSEPNELSDEEEEQLANRNANYLNTHPWLEHVAKYIAGKSEVASTSEVLDHILGGDKTRADQRAKTAVGDALRTLGCRLVSKRDGGKIRKVWRIADEHAAAKATTARVVPLRPTGR